MAHLKINQLRKIIAEEIRNSLREAKDEPEKIDDSLDAQVDRYFASYETESKLSKNEGKDFRMFLRRFLTEAEDDEKDKKEEKPKEPKKLTAEDIDVENFVDSVMRLVDNYDSLLEIRSTLLKRAVNFLLKGYEPDVAKSFEEALLEIHGMEIDKSKSETEDDNYQIPAADRAGTSPGA